MCLTYLALVNKNIIPLIVRDDRCNEIFPCRGFNNSLQVNGFAWIISKDLQNLEKIKEKCDEVYDIIKHQENINRDYHKAAITKCKNSTYRINSEVDIQHDEPVYYGFTSPYIPKTDEYYVLGIIQRKSKRKRKNNKINFNAAGGKKELIWNDTIEDFEEENFIDSVIREIWEELGIEFDKKLFDFCLDKTCKSQLISEVKNRKGNIMVYNLNVPDASKLTFTKVNWQNFDTIRYKVSLL